MREPCLLSMPHTVSVEVDRLFLHTLEDLERRTTAADEYEVLMSAALLR